MSANPAETFLQEADELLATIEAAALTLAGDAGGEGVHLVFRAFHTIKGSGAMFGFDRVAAFTHHVETLLDHVREGRVPVTGPLCDVILQATDHIRTLLEFAQGGPSPDDTAEPAILAAVERILTAGGSDPASPAAPPPPRKWEILFRPHPNLLAHGGNPRRILEDLAALGECRVEALLDRLPGLAELDPEQCYLGWRAHLSAACSAEEIRDVFLFVEDGSELAISLCEAAPPDPATRPAPPVPAPPVPAPAAAPAAKEATVRVPAERLDRLVNLVGELVMNQSRLATAASRQYCPDLAGPIEEIERLVAELRDDVLQIRMMPIGSIFGRFRRLVHDLSGQLGKEIDLETEGEETELDKSILDQMGEPLVHLLRNAIDHGIEGPEERVARGKSRRGAIRLTARHRGSDVVVTLSDDGAGMNRAAIRARAIARHLIPADANLSDKELLDLILLPGFSTAERVTSVSGRGVGMDVVKRQIDALRGTLHLCSTEGQGSSIALTLPITLAIIDGLLVEAGDSRFILPMTVVSENVELSRRDRHRQNGRNVVAVRGELVPYIDLREEFEMGGEAPAIAKVVLTRYEGQRVGIVVDRVLGTHQTVIQALGRFLRRIQVVSGATVMGDGRVALILDVAGVVRLVEGRHRHEGPGARPAVNPAAWNAPAAISDKRNEL